MIAKFLKYVEITTKITSTFAFFLTLAYLFFLETDINWQRTVIFFAAMFLFDLTATSINNYIDTKTNHQTLQFKRPVARLITFALLGISILLGLWLAYLTDIVVLLTGILCFFFGIFYTYGPVPISRQPYGEFFSGVFYGFFIPFLIMYINLPPETYLSFGLSRESLFLTINFKPILYLLLLSVAPMFTTANIMLANNTCDVERDVQVKRYTLPYYLGEKKSLVLFSALYYATYLATIIMVIINMLPPVVLISLITIIPVYKNIKIFKAEQVKETTFIVSIKNYILIMGANTLALFIAGLL